jgi:hypothetical protein
MALGTRLAERRTIRSGTPADDIRPSLLQKVLATVERVSRCWLQFRRGSVELESLTGCKAAVQIRERIDRISVSAVIGADRKGQPAERIAT